MTEDIKNILGIILTVAGSIALLMAAIACVSLMTTRVTINEYNDKCLFEVEGNENRQFPYYELHPMEDCGE